jgi:hypothetical protein
MATNRMDGLYLDVFRYQIYRECKFAIMAVEDMKKSLVVVRKAESEKDENGFWNLPKRDEGIWRFWYSAEAFLKAAGNLSKVFWPPQPRNSRKLASITKERGQHLRRILGISEESPLKNRALRDHFEHYDERIDEWFEGGKGDVIDSQLWERQHLAKRKGYFRNFDPEEWVLFFVGDELEIRPVIKAVEELQRKVSTPLSDRGISDYIL